MVGRSALPSKVVRFYGNVEYALETLAQRQITFVHVSKLNDPFDPYFFLETSFDANYEKLVEWVKLNHPIASSWFTAEVSKDHWEEAVDGIRKQMQNHRDNTFVFSCSAVTNDSHPKDNLYMRGHYGNGHRGVAIEFNTRETSSLLTQISNATKGQNRPTEDAWIKVEYEHKISPLTCQIFFDFFKSEHDGDKRRTSLHEYYYKTSRVKSIVWKREVEWRMLWMNDETRLKVHRAQIPHDAVSAVYVGLSTPEATEADIRFEVSRNFPGAKLYRARKKLSFTQLEFKQVDYAHD